MGASGAHDRRPRRDGNGERRAVRDGQTELFGDKVDRKVDFAEDGKVADFAGRPVTITFEMIDADLYSFRFNDACGR